MIIKYYGGYVKKSNLLELTKTGKNGTTAYNIKEALTNLGFDAKGISCELKDINKENIIFPFIASVTIDNTYKIAFVGLNELAKTTLFKIINGELEPDSGTIKIGTTVTISYFPKNHDNYFKSDKTLVDFLRDYSKEKEETSR